MFNGKLHEAAYISSVYIAQPLIPQCRFSINYLASIEMIRDYFGEKIGIYFSFLGFYTKALFLPAAFGLLYFLLDTFVGHLPHGYAIFAIFNLFWTTLFLEFWKRKCSSKAFRWGTYGERVYYFFLFPGCSDF